MSLGDTEKRCFSAPKTDVCHFHTRALATDRRSVMMFWASESALPNDVLPSNTTSNPGPVWTKGDACSGASYCKTSEPIHSDGVDCLKTRYRLRLHTLWPCVWGYFMQAALLHGVLRLDECHSPIIIYDQPPFSEAHKHHGTHTHTAYSVWMVFSRILVWRENLPGKFLETS